MSNPWSFDLYSRGQQIVILLLVIGIIVLSLTLRFYQPSPPYFAGRDDLLAAAQALDQQQSVAVNRYLDEASSKSPSAAFPFNPNTVTEAELQQLGLTSKQAKSWLKYRAGRTDRFKRPEDIGKLYVLNEATVKRLLPLVNLSLNQPPVSSTVPSERVAESAVESFFFDPNTVTETELIRLGIPDYKAQSFLKYRSRLQKPFQSAQELDKIRVFSEEQKARLKALVRIESATPALVNSQELRPQENEERGTSISSNERNDDKAFAQPTTYEYTPSIAKTTTVSAPDFILDLNTATQLDLEQLPGIGPYWAKRLLNFRDKLGGFASVQQVATTYGLADSTFQQIQPFLSVTTPVFRKIAVNLWTTEELKAHPYIKYKLANIIVKFREQHGPFSSVTALRRIRLFTLDVEQQLLPYLDFRLE